RVGLGAAARAARRQPPAAAREPPREGRGFRRTGRAARPGGERRERNAKQHEVEGDRPGRPLPFFEEDMSRYQEVPSKLDVPALEKRVLRFWDENGSFDKLREQNRGRETWSFLDGPITANNPMGVHHAWGRSYKDMFQRYHAMLGQDERWQNGFDCQGL